jgi:hypothetical protein
MQFCTLTDFKRIFFFIYNIFTRSQKYERGLRLEVKIHILLYRFNYVPLRLDV